jgi:hypothetical protein
VRIFVTAVITTLVACSLTASARANTQDHCDEKQDQWFHQADPKTWGGLYRLFKEFGQCDDGAIGEATIDEWRAQAKQYLGKLPPESGGKFFFFKVVAE